MPNQRCHESARARERPQGISRAAIAAAGPPERGIQVIARVRTQRAAILDARPFPRAENLHAVVDVELPRAIAAVEAIGTVGLVGHKLAAGGIARLAIRAGHQQGFDYLGTQGVARRAVLQQGDGGGHQRGGPAHVRPRPNEMRQRSAGPIKAIQRGREAADRRRGGAYIDGVVAKAQQVAPVTDNPHHLNEVALVDDPVQATENVGGRSRAAGTARPAVIGQRPAGRDRAREIGSVAVQHLIQPAVDLVAINRGHTAGHEIIAGQRLRDAGGVPGESRIGTGRTVVEDQVGEAIGGRICPIQRRTDVWPAVRLYLRDGDMRAFGQRAAKLGLQRAKPDIRQRVGRTHASCRSEQQRAGKAQAHGRSVVGATWHERHGNAIP